MSAEAKERAPVPLDPSGNEVCLLFLKYGKCRYKNKCKKSHILPDKNAPLMQKITEIIVHQPAARPGPKIAFSVRKSTPYARSQQSRHTAVHPASELRQFASNSSQRGAQRQSVLTTTSGDECAADRQPMDPTALVTSPIDTDHDIDTNRVANIMVTSMMDDQEMSSKEHPPKTGPPRKTKPRRPAKVPSKCLMAPLFRNTIPTTSTTINRREPPMDTFQLGLPASSKNEVVAGARSKKALPKLKSTLAPKTKTVVKSGSKFVAPSSAASSYGYSTNESEAGSEKIEQWYITNKAHLEPGVGKGVPRRLMVLIKPTTVRQKGQLKGMRKHHWECRTEIEQNLTRNIPAAFLLKIVRTRIDWERIAPYVTLMIQAAFDMDINHNHLPVLGMTMCAQLEHRELGGLACEELLVSWGLTEIDARRFTSHLWEMLVAAAGEADLRAGKGVGFRVRQFEHRKDFIQIQAKLLTLNKAPT